MAYKALYRTYRPTTFAEVYGQKHIVQTLTNAIKENKIAHAYLFCGPRGTGKTSMARLFAKALNCQEGLGHQCNKCSSCIEINEGTHPDVIEMDAASNRGIDDIRDLVSKIKYAPINGKYKIYIIDEVHMMTAEAFNALLKTLEEPPANVVFILATTEPHKLMPTILSRVQRYDFNKVSDKDLLDNLIRVVKSEKVKYEEEALKLIVSLSDGGVRDSLSLLDQALAYSQDDLSAESVRQLYGITTISQKLELLRLVNEADVLGSTTKLDEFVNHGVDIKRLTLDLIEILKDLLIYATTKNGNILKYLDHEDCEKLKISKDKLLKMLDILMDCFKEFRSVSNAKSLLEISILKLCALSLEKDEVAEVKTIIKEVPVEVVKEVVKKEEPKEEKKVVKQNLKYDVPLIELGETYYLSVEDTLNLMQQGNKQEKNEVQAKWNKLSDYFDDPVINKYALTLSKTTPLIVAENILVVEANFDNITNRIIIKENQKGFNLLVKEITGKDYLILVLSIKDRVDRIKKYTDLRQANKLPSLYKIDIKY